MLELIEKTVMTAIGAAALTQKKAEELVAEMKERYRMSEDEGKTFVTRIQAMAADSRDRIREMAEIEVKKAADRLGLVSRDEYETILKRVQDLESRLNG